jgi:hypothetical protein
LDDPEYDFQTSLIKKGGQIRIAQEEHLRRILLIERLRDEGIDAVAEERLECLGI